jgi:hypothetical protein
LQELGYVSGDAFADTFNGVEPFRPHQLFYRLSQRRYGFRCSPVYPRFERVFASDFHQVGSFFKHRDDFCILHVHITPERAGKGDAHRKTVAHNYRVATV